jgi:hypothetical protein
VVAHTVDHPQSNITRFIYRLPELKAGWCNDLGLFLSGFEDPNRENPEQHVELPLQLPRMRGRRTSVDMLEAKSDVA